MVISHKHKFIFFAAGRTGSKSIATVLDKYDEPCPFTYDYQTYSAHMPPRIFKSLCPPEIWDTYFKFAFVRNTWDWLISMFLWNCPGQDRKIEVMTPELFEQHWERMKGFRRGLTADNRYQYDFLADEDGRLLVNYFGRFERLQADFDRICDALHLPLETLPVTHQIAHKPYQSYYTPDMVALVGRRYSKDIREFGFKFSGQCFMGEDIRGK